MKVTVHEVCAWSDANPQHGEHRYVQVLDSAGRTHMLELPADDAALLGRVFGESQRQIALLEQQRGPVNGWFSYSTLQTAASLVARLAGLHTAWLGKLSLKYIHLRIDLRTGEYLFTDNEGHAASDQVLNLMKEKLK